MNSNYVKTGLDRSIEHIGVIMEKHDTKVYPKYELPIGFSFSSYKSGFEKQWMNLQYEVEEVDTLEEAETAFVDEFLYGKGMDWVNKSCVKLNSNEIINAPKYKEMFEKMVFVLDNTGTVVGTGSLWDGNIFGITYQRLHWIAVSPNYQGLGIAKAIVTKLLDIYNELGYNNYIYLTSQTWSYHALNIYSKFGFKAYMGEKPLNWKAVNLTSGNFEPWDYNEKNMEAWDLINEKINRYTERASK